MTYWHADFFFFFSKSALIFFPLQISSTKRRGFKAKGTVNAPKFQVLWRHSFGSNLISKSFNTKWQHPKNEPHEHMQVKTQPRPQLTVNPPNSTRSGLRQKRRRRRRIWICHDSFLFVHSLLCWLISWRISTPLSYQFSEGTTCWDLGAGGDRLSVRSRKRPSSESPSLPPTITTRRRRLTTTTT